MEENLGQFSVHLLEDRTGQPPIAYSRSRPSSLLVVLNTNVYFSFKQVHEAPRSSQNWLIVRLLASLAFKEVFVRLKDLTAFVDLMIHEKDIGQIVDN